MTEPLLRDLSTRLLGSIHVDAELAVAWNGRTYRSPDRLLKDTAASSPAMQAAAAIRAFAALAEANRAALCGSSDHMVLWVNKASRPLLGIQRSTPVREAAKTANLGGRALMAMRSRLRGDDPTRTTRLAVVSDQPRWMSWHDWTLNHAVPEVLRQLAADHKLQALLTGVLDEAEQAACWAASDLKVPVWAYTHPDRESAVGDPFRASQAAVEVPLPRLAGSLDEQDLRDAQSRTMLRECDSVLAIIGPRRLPHTVRAIRYATESGKPLVVIDGRNRRVHASWPTRLPSLDQALAPVG